MCIGHVNSRHSNHCNVQCTCILGLFSLSTLHFMLQLERSQFEQTVNHINGIFDEAERVGARTYLEGFLGCITAYLIFTCIQTQYNKVTITATIISSFSFHFRSSYMIYFIYHEHSFLSREHMNPQLTCSQRQWLHSSVGRASHRYREVTGSNPVEVLNFFFFQASLHNFINCVHCDDHFFIFNTQTIAKGSIGNSDINSKENIKI